MKELQAIEVPTRRPPGGWEGNEQAFQKQAMRIVKLASPPGTLAWHTPNEGKRSAWHAKDMGILAGIPDVVAIFPPLDLANLQHGPQVPGMAIELKVWPNKPTQAQLERLADFARVGWAVRVTYGIDDLVGFLGRVGLNVGRTLRHNPSAR